jgi:hypothetical protein
MQLFRASSPQDEVAGDSILAFTNAMGAFRSRALQVLQAHGLPDPAAGTWYPLQSYLDALREIYQTRGPAMISVTGRKLVEGHRFTEAFDGIAAALSSLDRDYHARHRGADVGSYQVSETGPDEVTVIVRNPYPCEIDRAVVEALATRFRPRGSVVRVEHDGPCRHDGASACTLRVRW